MTADETFEALKYRIVIDERGIKYYYNKEGEVHRDEGPAIIAPTGVQYWVSHDIFHRTDGPAIIYPNGRDEYWENNQFICSNGVPYEFCR